MGKTVLSYIILSGFLSILMIGCKSIKETAYNTAYRNSAICLAYPTERGIIKDQAEIASIAIGNEYGLTIDGLHIVSPKGELNKEIRAVNNSSSKPMLIIDVLPGKHILEIERKRSSATVEFTLITKPFVEEVYLEPGNIYLLEMNNAANIVLPFKTISVKKDKQSTSNIILTPLSDEHKQLVIELRNRLSFE